MTLTLILAIGVPISALMSTAAARRLRPGLAADIRGIALQTVVIIVVMLVIAGGVAAVLTTRGGEAIGQLESQGVVGAQVDSLAKCTTAGGERATTATGQVNAAAGTACFFANANASPFTCALYKDHNGNPGTVATHSTRQGADAGCVVDFA